MDIQKIIATAKASGASVVTDARVSNVTIFVAKNDNVDYWAKLSINKIVPGMLVRKNEDGTEEYYKGNTRTITVPLGTVMTLLFDYLIEQESDEALDLVDYKKIIYTDAEREAIAPSDRPYISHLHKLLNATSVNVIARDVNKGDAVTSLFSLNEKITVASNDSVWHDLYGLAKVRDSKIAEALAWCKATNAAAVDTTADKASAFDKLMASLKNNSSHTAIENALA